MCHLQGADILTSFYVFILFLGLLDLISINKGIVKNHGIICNKRCLVIYSQRSFLQKASMALCLL